MRTPNHLSYSSFSLLKTNDEEYYLKHLADHRPPRLKQTPPMAVGSAFDAKVKSQLAEDLDMLDERLAYPALFESQVEEHNREEVAEAGERCFEAYVQAGAYERLLKALQPATAIQFESEVNGTLENGVPLTGKPDVRFAIEVGPEQLARFVMDFKVKQYYSKYAASPSPGFQLCVDGFTGKPSRSNNTSHKLYKEIDYRGYAINEFFLEAYNDDYAAQISMYAWLLGEKPGAEDYIVWIDELCCDAKVPTNIRVATHKARVSKKFQLDLYNSLEQAWHRITSGHFFPHLSLEESQAQCQILEDTAKALSADEENSGWFSDVTRPQLFR